MPSSSSTPVDPPSTPPPAPTGGPNRSLRVAIGPALTWHRDLDAGGGLQTGLELGVGPWSVGGTVRAFAPRSVPGVPGMSEMYAADGLLVAGWTPDGPVRPALQALGGVSFRSFDQAGQTRASFPLPVLGASVGIRTQLGAAVKLGAAASFEADLGETTVRIGERPVEALAVWQVGGAVTLIMAMP